MKVLMLNGSPRPAGNTAAALKEIGAALNREGIEYEIFQIDARSVCDCIGCHRCTERGCVFEDGGVNDFIEKARHADAFVFGTPVYYGHPSGSILSFLDRVFFSSSYIFKGKPSASIAIARRAGTTSALDVLNKYLTISGMHLIGSSYWNVAFGRAPGEVCKDEEGMQTMRNLGANLAWALKLRQLSGISMPEPEKGSITNFIR